VCCDPNCGRNIYNNITRCYKDHVVEELRARGNVFQKRFMFLMLMLFQRYGKVKEVY